MAANKKPDDPKKKKDGGKETKKKKKILEEDDFGAHPTDDIMGFFAYGRDIESVGTNHYYTAQEKMVLSEYDACDYLPPHSVVYKHWLKQQPALHEFDKWLMMALIGMTTGCVYSLMHQMVELISDNKWKKVNSILAYDGGKTSDNTRLLNASLYLVLLSSLMVFIGAALVVFVRPSAAGSGLPELIGYLNGTVVPRIFNIKTMVVKFVSCTLAVSGGMPVGVEGPMIHLGSLIGAGLSQMESATIGFSLPFFESFRNSEDRRNFVSAGAAAGVAAAFGAPVGGLLFSMEEVSSFWDQRLMWQIFFCSMVSAITSDIINSAFSGFAWKEGARFGSLAPDSIIFKIDVELQSNVLTFIPAVLIGILGGILGSIFTFTALKITRLRRRLMSKIKLYAFRETVRLLEPIVLVVIYTLISTLLPSQFECSKVACVSPIDGEKNVKIYGCVEGEQVTISTEEDLIKYTCAPGAKYGNNMEGFTLNNSSYSEMATLMLSNVETAIHHLFSRKAHTEFDWQPLLTILPIYFFLACWATGCSISCGLVIPMLFIGSIYGRLAGVLMIKMFGIYLPQESHGWMDPGAFALIGAASFFAGVARLTVSLAVIMIEITNDVQFLLPIMATIMVAKWVADIITHPLYHALLEVKCIPFLDVREPLVSLDGKTPMTLEMFRLDDVMTPKPHTFMQRVKVRSLAKTLYVAEHGGFPIVQKQQRNNVFYGSIAREELINLLHHDHCFHKLPEGWTIDRIDLEYRNGLRRTATFQEIHFQKGKDEMQDRDEEKEFLEKFIKNKQYNQYYIDLHPYVNQSALSLPASFSLHRAYIIFRTIGLRHLTVTDRENQVVGVVTRKDLMGWAVEERLRAKMRLPTEIATKADSKEKVKGKEQTDANEAGEENKA